jgi:predicted transcriptional regulator of viral defense system
MVGILIAIHRIKCGKLYAMREPSSREVERAVEVFRKADGVLRTSEVLVAGVEERTLYWMREQGVVEPLSRGVYHLAEWPLPAFPDVAGVLARTPRAVLCLVSALEFHAIGTQVPSAVQIALPRGVKAPRIMRPRIESFSMSAEAISAGVEQHETNGIAIKVFCVAKTVADCFKYRSRIGQYVAVEALQESIRTRRATPGEIMGYATVDRVERVLRPYLEALS